MSVNDIACIEIVIIDYPLAAVTLNIQAGNTFLGNDFLLKPNQSQTQSCTCKFPAGLNSGLSSKDFIFTFNTRHHITE